MAFRSSSHTGSGNDTQAALPVPTGAATNDIAVVSFYLQSAATVTPPSGFTLKSDINAGSHHHLIYWKRLTGADTGFYTFTWTGSAYREGVCALFSGRTTSGDPFESFGTNTASSTACTVTALSPAASGDDLVGMCTNFNGGAWTAPSGMTEREDQGIVITLDTADAVASGSTGNKTFTCGSSGDEGAFLGALLPAGGSGGSVTAVVATATDAAVAPAVSGGAAVTAVKATTAAAAVAPTVSGIRNATVAAVVATASLLAPPPAVTAVRNATVAAVAATATADAGIPTVSGETVVSGGGPATSTLAAVAPVVRGGATVAAVVATGTTTAVAPAVSASGTGSVTAVAASASASAIAPTVVGIRNATVAAVAATATTAAVAPGVTISVTLGAVTATATATAIPPAVRGGAATTAVAATATVAANPPTVTATGVNDGSPVRQPGLTLTGTSSRLALTSPTSTLELDA